MVSETLIDPSRIDALRRVLKPDALDNAIVAFQSAIGERAEEIRSAVASGDLIVAARLAHSIKGLCGNFGASRLAELCARIEDLLASGAGEPTAGDMDDIVETAQQTRYALAAIQEQLRTT